ncbi:MAG: dockerin type I domain-containing protein, partial [Planctomycetota bacterium]|nr:dockerin type I domain-containing protein [Planctomycetota bacterium]
MSDDPSTRQVDETGQYSLLGLDAGTYVIRELVPSGYDQTAGGSQAVYANAFNQPAGPNNPVGNEWSTDRVTTSPNGTQQFLGLFDNETVTLTLPNLPAHDELLVSFDLIIAGSWNGDNPQQGPDRWQLAVRGGQTLLDTTFSNTGNSFPTWQNPVREVDVDGNGVVIPLDVLLVINEVNLHNARKLPVPPLQMGSQATFYDVSGEGDLTPLDVLIIVDWLNNPSHQDPASERLPWGAGLGEFFPQAFPAAYGAGQHVPRTGAAATDTLGYDAFSLPTTDARYRGQDTVYHLTYTLPHGDNSLVLDFRALGLTNRGLDFEKWGLDNVVVAIPSSGYAVQLKAGQIVRGIDFGNQPTKLREADRLVLGQLAGPLGEAEPPPESQIVGAVWTDLDGNGKREALEAGLADVTVYADLNQNGKLDTDEPRAVTQAGSAMAPAGAYRLTGFFASTVIVRELVPDGYVQTFPFGPGGFHSVTLQPGQTVSQIDFGDQPAGQQQDRNEIRGLKWHDLNGDGQRQIDEPGLAGVTIYADLNQNATLDAKEPSTVTQVGDAATPVGSYRLTGLPVGTIIVRE